MKWRLVFFIVLFFNGCITPDDQVNLQKTTALACAEGDATDLAAGGFSNKTGRKADTTRNGKVVVVSLGLSLARSSNGCPLLAYFDGPRGVLEILACIDKSCSSNQSIVENVKSSLGSTDINDYGRFPAMSLGFEGFPLIAYNVETNSRIALSRCLDSACSTASTTFVATNKGQDGFGFTVKAIGIGKGGKPVLAYRSYSPSSNFVHLAICEDANCAKVTTRVIAETDSFGSPNPSLAILSDGRPIISFVGELFGDDVLWVYACRDALCSMGDYRVIDIVSSPYVDHSLRATSNDELVIVYDRGELIFDNSERQDTGPEDDHLRLVICPKPDCSEFELHGLKVTSNLSFVTGDSYWSVSDVDLVLDANNYPVLIYGLENHLNAMKGELWLTRCLSKSCTNSLETQVASGVSADLLDPSLSFATDKRVTVAFYNFLDDIVLAQIPIS